MLFVCTGNVCRSPVAERVMRSRLAPGLPIAVSSAGTMGLSGYPIDPPSALALRELGGDSEGHVARRLTYEILAGADLILTAESKHRSAIVRDEPVLLRQAFTIREFGRLGQTIPAALPEPVTEEGLRERVWEVAGQRGWADPPHPGQDEIGDPFGAPLEVARDRARQVAEGVEGVMRALGLSVRTR